MGATLHWKPAKVSSDQAFCRDLRIALQKSLLNGRSEVIVNGDNIPYFEGLSDAGIEDAQTVIDLISKHEEICLCLQY